MGKWQRKLSTGNNHKTLTPKFAFRDSLGELEKERRAFKMMIISGASSEEKWKRDRGKGGERRERLRSLRSRARRRNK